MPLKAPPVISVPTLIVPPVCVIPPPAAATDNVPPGALRVPPFRPIPFAPADSAISDPDTPILPVTAIDPALSVTFDAVNGPATWTDPLFTRLKSDEALTAPIVPIALPVPSSDPEEIDPPPVVSVPATTVPAAN